MLRQYCQIYELQQEHVQHLMRPQQRDQEGGSCLDVLLATMQSMETRRTQKSLEPWSARVYKNAKLFVTDLTVSRGYSESSVLLDNKSLSIRERNLVLNPDLTGRGPRTNHLGQLDPYVNVENFIGRFINTQNAFLDVCLAYNLFGLTEVWFREFPLERWDQLTWDTFNDRNLLNVLVDETYPNTVRLSPEHFTHLTQDIERAFRLSVKIEPVENMQTIHMEGYHEPGQEWAAEGTPGYASSEGSFGMKRPYYGDEEPMIGSFTVEPSNTLLFGILVGGGALLYFNS